MLHFNAPKRKPCYIIRSIRMQAGSDRFTRIGKVFKINRIGIRKNHRVVQCIAYMFSPVVSESNKIELTQWQTNIYRL